MSGELTRNKKSEEFELQELRGKNGRIKEIYKEEIM